MSSSSWLSSTPQWEHVFARSDPWWLRQHPEHMRQLQEAVNRASPEFTPYPGKPLVAPLAMSDPPSGSVASPHDWDESTRVCKRCKCTSTDWQLGNATMCLDRNPGDTDLTGTCPACGETYSYWGNASAQVPKCRSCSPVPKAAVDDVAYIRRRIEEIAKERQPVALVDEWAASILRAAVSLRESVAANLMESPTSELYAWVPYETDNG